MPKQPTILVVDDDEDDRELLREACQESGHACELVFAANGQKALDLLVKGALLPDVILLDINMPGIDGFTVLTRIRQLPALREVPVVMLTTSSRPESIEKARELGASGYLVKPRDFDLLVQTWQRFYRSMVESTPLFDFPQPVQ